MFSAGEMEMKLSQKTQVKAMRKVFAVCISNILLMRHNLGSIYKTPEEYPYTDRMQHTLVASFGVSRTAKELPSFTPLSTSLHFPVTLGCEDTVSDGSR